MCSLLRLPSEICQKQGGPRATRVGARQTQCVGAGTSPAPSGRTGSKIHGESAPRSIRGFVGAACPPAPSPRSRGPEAAGGRRLDRPCRRRSKHSRSVAKSATNASASRLTTSAGEQLEGCGLDPSAPVGPVRYQPRRGDASRVSRRDERRARDKSEATRGVDKDFPLHTPLEGFWEFCVATAAPAEADPVRSSRTPRRKTAMDRRKQRKCDALLIWPGTGSFTSPSAPAVDERGASVSHDAIEGPGSLLSVAWTPSARCDGETLWDSAYLRWLRSPRAEASAEALSVATRDAWAAAGGNGMPDSRTAASRIARAPRAFPVRSTAWVAASTVVRKLSMLREPSPATPAAAAVPSAPLVPMCRRSVISSRRRCRMPPSLVGGSASRAYGRIGPVSTSPLPSPTPAPAAVSPASRSRARPLRRCRAVGSCSRTGSCFSVRTQRLETVNSRTRCKKHRAVNFYRKGVDARLIQVVSLVKHDNGCPVEP